MADDASTTDKDLLMRRVAAYVAALIVIGFFVILGVLMFREVPTGNKETVIQMLGALILSLGTLMGYLYGSSKSTESKDRLLANSTPTSTLTVTPTPKEPTA